MYQPTLFAHEEVVIANNIKIVHRPGLSNIHQAYPIQLERTAL